MTDILDGFNPRQPGILLPEMVVSAKARVPSLAISCFSKKLHDAMLDRHGGEAVGKFKTEDGGIPIYKVAYHGYEVALYMSRVGAAAAVIQLEEIIAMGARKLVVMGSCGALTKDIQYGDLFLPVSGIRDEGTSYHYAPAEAEVRTSERIIAVMEEELNHSGLKWWKGKTWTTDGLYRETEEKFLLRKSQGCRTVEMEYTGLQAAAAFRGIEFGQIFYCEDNLDHPEWEDRGYLPANQEKSEQLLELPFRCVTKI